jgi:hypothetical protein
VRGVILSVRKEEKMKLRYEEYIGLTYYYTKCNKNGTWEVVKDEDYDCDDYEPEIVYSGRYDDCVNWIKNEYAEWEWHCTF